MSLQNVDIHALHDRGDPIANRLVALIRRRHFRSLFMTRIHRPLGLHVSGAALALTLALSSPLSHAAGKKAPAQAQPTATQAAVLEQVNQLMERVRQLEQSNQALTQQVKELRAHDAGHDMGAVAQEEARLRALEQQQMTLKEHVKAMTHPAEAAQAAAAAPADDKGLKVTGTLVTVVQQVNAKGSGDGERQAALNYRGDLVATMPAGDIGSAKGSVAGHLRFGQGQGLALRPTYSSTANSTAFEATAGSADTYAIVAEAYYRLDWAFGGEQAAGVPGDWVNVSVGKMDFFGAFDQNAVASDESGQFLNNVFVHNPLLDSGGDIAADAYGFAPGLRLAYMHTGAERCFGASLGVFGSGPAASFASGVSRPLVIGQLEWSPMKDAEQALGTYRLYGWSNGRTTDLDGQEQRHSGVGLSADQHVGDDWNLFGRWGKRTAGDGAFDQALTLGFEYAGRGWGREHDGVGLAMAWLKTDSAWRDANAGAVSGSERIAELYYRIKLNDHLELTPDYQFVQRAGGDDTAARIHVLGLRARLGF
jgi:high affinity Mn2+ porin